MSRDEVVQNIGTIAKSGTREFFQALTGDQARCAPHRTVRRGLLFLVHRRRPGHPAHPARGPSGRSGVRWESDGGGEFTVEPAEKAERGTDVILHLRKARTSCVRMEAESHHPQILRSHRDPHRDEKVKWTRTSRVR